MKNTYYPILMSRWRLRSILICKVWASFTHQKPRLRKVPYDCHVEEGNEGEILLPVSWGNQKVCKTYLCAAKYAYLWSFKSNCCGFSRSDIPSTWRGFSSHHFLILQGYYVENGTRNNLESLECIDMLGVTDHCFVNDKELSCDRVKSERIDPSIMSSCQ